MKVQVLESGLYQGSNLIEMVHINKGTKFDVLEKYGLDGIMFYRVKTGDDKRVNLYPDQVQVLTETGTEHRRYLYAIVREDLELKDKLVQVAHATYESGLAFKNTADRTSLIVLVVPDENSLHLAKARLQRKGIGSVLYKEHSLGLGYTALATEAITEEQRSVLKKYKLLKV